MRRRLVCSHNIGGGRQQEQLLVQRRNQRVVSVSVAPVLKSRSANASKSRGIGSRRGLTRIAQANREIGRIGDEARRRAFRKHLRPPKVPQPTSAPPYWDVHPVAGFL